MIKQRMKKGLGILLSIAMTVTCIPVIQTSAAPAPGSDNLSVSKMRLITIEYNKNGQYAQSREAGFVMSDGSIAACCTEGVSAPKIGRKFKAAHDLGDSYQDGDKYRPDTRWAFKCFYYAEKYKKEINGKDGVNLTVAIANATRKRFTKESGEVETSSTGQIKLTREIIRLASQDADDIHDFIKIKNGDAYMNIGGGKVARMCRYRPTTNKPLCQDLMVYSPEIPNVYNPTGNIIVHKHDENGNSLEGATFGLYNLRNQMLMSMVTDLSGRCLFLQVPVGKYIVKEISFPKNYESADGITSWNVTVENGKTVEVGGRQGVTNVLKKGAIAIRKVDKDGNPLGGVKFGVYSDESAKDLIAVVNTGTDGVAYYGNYPEYSLKHGTTYYFQEMKTKDPTYIGIDTVFPVTVAHSKITFANENSAVINYQKHWRVIVTKKDRDNVTAQGMATLKGAVYGLYDGDDTLLAKYTTDENGKFTTDYYLAGTGYYLKEIKPSEGYQLDTEKHYLNDITSPYVLTKEYTDVMKTVYEDVIEGTVTLDKFHNGRYDLENYDVPETGAQFAIYSLYESSTVYDSCIIDENGHAVWKKTGTFKSAPLPYGSYKLVQTMTPENVIPMEDKVFVVDKNNVDVRFTVRNDIYTMNLTIGKIDAETNKLIYASHAKFKILDLTENQFVKYNGTDIFVTDDKGQIKMPIKLPYGNYELHEIESPSGYFLGSEPYRFIVDKTFNGSLYITVKNDPLKGYLSIEKKGLKFTGYSQTESDRGNVYTPIFTNEYLPGAVFDIYAAEDIYTGDGTRRYSKDEKVDTVTTAAEGPVISKNLYIGNYYVKESTVPGGYKPNDTTYNIEIKNDGMQMVSSLSLTIMNERIKTEAKLHKTADFLSVVTQNKEMHQEIMVKDAAGFVFGLYTAEKIPFEVGEGYIPANALIEAKSTDEKGNIIFTSQLPFGKYYIKEIATPEENYLLDNTKHQIDCTITPASHTDICMNLGTVHNTLITYDVDITKQDITNAAPVSGAEIEIRDSNNVIVFKGVTDENGIITAKLQPGVYTFIETTFPNGFIHNTKTYTFSINKDGVISGDTKFTNTPTEVVIKKTDSTTGNALSGAEIAIFDAFGNEVHRGVTDEKGFLTVKYLPIGNYTFKETKAPTGYALDGTVHSFVIDNMGNVVGTIKIENKPTEVVIKKTDEDGNALSGAEFEVFDKDGQSVMKAMVNKNGELKLTYLPVGTYTFKETIAPSGYGLNPEIFTFSIDEFGKVTGETEMTNAMTVVTFIKKDSETKKVLAGAEITVYDEQGEEVCKGVTDENGEFTVKKLPVGKYSFKETKAPEGYDLNNQTYFFEINKFGQVIGNTELFNIKTIESVPVTGDDVSMHIGTLTIMLFAVSIVFFCKKKRS